MLWITGAKVNVRSSVIRAVSVTSYLTSTVLMAAYSAKFISYLAVQELKLPFSTYEGLLDDGRYRLLAVSGTAQLNYFDVSMHLRLELVVFYFPFFPLISVFFHNSHTCYISLRSFLRYCWSPFEKGLMIKRLNIEITRQSQPNFYYFHSLRFIRAFCADLAIFR